MRNSIGLRWTTGAARLLLVASLVIAAVVPAARPVTAPTAPPIPAPVERVIGSGPLETLGCLGCAGVVVGLGGTTVLGVVGLLAAWPEIGIGCGLACYNAFR